MEAARKRPELSGLSTTHLPNVPRVFVKVDRDKVLKLGVPLGDVYRTLQTFMGGYFVNYFNRFGRQWQVFLEAEEQYRTRAENLGQFYVRNNLGQSVPLGCVPLWMASGSGGISRKTLGTVVIGGMLDATLVTFSVVEKLVARYRRHPSPAGSGGAIKENA
jgi:multidrug efflux pump subunit AcrB